MKRPMELTEIVDFKKGRTYYDSFFLDFDKPLCNQKDELVEDMFGYLFDKDYVMDLGWYPSMDCKGKFKIYLVETNASFEKPNLYLEARDYDQLINAINKCIDYVENV